MRYRITSSCMQPSGAYARTQASFTDEIEARAAFRVAYFEGPDYGIIWSRTVTLSQGEFVDGQYVRTVLDTRTMDEHTRGSRRTSPNPISIIL